MTESPQIRQRPCPACMSDKAKRSGLKNGFEIMVCDSCDSIFSAHLPTQGEHQDYDEYYSEETLAVPEFIDRRVEEIVATFEGSKKNSRLLDIGFGAATILKAARKLGWDAQGLEVSKPAIEHARALGFEAFHGDLTAANYPDGYFDVVTASEIIEHLPDPQTFLKEIFRILRPGGLFWATTPSANSLSFRLLRTEWSVVYPPEHLQLYSRNGLRQMLNQAGFDDVDLRTHGLNPMEIAHHYRSKFGANKAAPLDGVERNRGAHALNEELMKSPLRRAVKAGLNSLLNVTGQGDSVKIYAHR